MVMITFKGTDESQTVEANIGDTILDVAKKNKIKIYGGCDGSCICGSCHIHIQGDGAKKAKAGSEISDQEADILDILDNVDDTSRLACQVRITEELDGMIVLI